jgi:hypothetical protein
MLKSRRLFGAALLLALPLGLAPTPGAAQDTNTVGNPQLKHFSLPGTRTTPAPAPPTPAPAPAPVSVTPPPRPAPASPVERPRPTRAPPPRAAARPRPQVAPAAPAPPAAAPTPAVTPPEAAPQAPAPPPAPAPAPAPEERRVPWAWIALAALAVVGIAALLLLRRRRAALVEEEPAEAPALLSREEEPERPAVAEAAAASPPVEAEKRAWVDIDIRPDRATALEDGAMIHYALTLTNRGEATAGNLRIDGRMFNASADGEVDAFFRAPIHEISGSPQVRLDPGASMTLEGQIGMPKAELHAIEVQGRVIFVPVIAINVAYDWEGGSGRTSRSWLVGREASTPDARMGAFRLDLGPRIYRQVDRRPAKQALV